MNRFTRGVALGGILISLALGGQSVSADDGVTWVCPNWGNRPTAPSSNAADPTACIYQGSLQDGAVPENWFADTERGRQDHPTTLSVTQITLRPTDPRVTAVVAPGQIVSAPVAVAQPVEQVSQPQQTAPIGSNDCLIYNGVQTQPLPDTGCRYIGPIVSGGFVPDGWMLLTGVPAVWYMPGQRVPVDFNVASFYRLN